VNTYIVTAHAIVSSLCWIIVGIGGGYAVFSPKVKDTTAERLALSCISLFAFATAFRVIKQGWISEGYLMMSMAFAFYVVVIIYKHWSKEHHKLPKDKMQATRLEPSWRPDANL